MIDGKADAAIVAGDLIAPAVADLVVDPASLAHLAGDASLSPGPAPLAGDALVLSLADLLPDAEGTVVMRVDQALPVSLVTDQALADGGADVEGLYYYSFANGLHPLQRYRHRHRQRAARPLNRPADGADRGGDPGYDAGRSATTHSARAGSPWPVTSSHMTA